MKDEYGALME